MAVVKYWCLIAISLAVGVFAELATAEPAAPVELKARFDRIDGVTAAFVQEIDDGRGQVIAEEQKPLIFRAAQEAFDAAAVHPQGAVDFVRLHERQRGCGMGRHGAGLRLAVRGDGNHRFRIAPGETE